MNVTQSQLLLGMSQCSVKDITQDLRVSCEILFILNKIWCVNSIRMNGSSVPSSDIYRRFVCLKITWAYFKVYGTPRYVVLVCCKTT